MVSAAESALVVCWVQAQLAQLKSDLEKVLQQRESLEALKTTLLRLAN